MSGNELLKRGERFHSRIQKRKYLILTVPLLLLLILYPVFEESFVGTIFLKLLSTATLITAVYAVSERRRPLCIALILAIPAIGTGWAVLVYTSAGFVLAQSTTSMLLYAFTTIMIVRSIIRGHLTDDMIFGAISVYLLMGITWATAYMSLEGSGISAFVINYGNGPGGLPAFSDFLYFSFITLATVGYGDITPLSAAARSLAYLEAVSGTLFMAVFIARLIGALASHQEDPGNKN
jgi:hypothetical protein